MRDLKLFALMALAVAGTAVSARSPKASSADERLQFMLRCNGIADQTARVACYDDAARQAMANAPAPAKTKSAASVPAAAPATQAPLQAAERSFGLENVPEARRPVQDRPAVVRLISAHVVARNDDGMGYYLFTLDNGMRWQMTEKTPLDLPEAGDTATIRRGLMGGYMMDVGRRAAVRVTRLQ